MNTEAPIRENDHRSIPQLFADATKDATELVRQEVRLARIEMSERVSAFVPSLVPLVCAMVLATAAVVILLMSAFLGLAHVVQPPAFAAALVGVGALLLALVSVAVGLGMLRSRRLFPHRTTRSLQRDKELVRRHI